MQVAQTSKEKQIKFLQIAGIVLVAGIAFWQLARTGFDWRSSLENSNPWLFFCGMASLPVFGFPISVCYIYAGMAFPPATAIACCLGALATNMSVSFGLAKTVFKKPVESFLKRRKWKIPELGEKNQFRFAFLVRTIPGPPFFAQNLVLGLSGIPFWTYLLISMATQGSIAIVVILCTRYLSNDPKSMAGIIAGTLVAVLILLKIAQALRKRYLKNKGN